MLFVMVEKVVGGKATAAPPATAPQTLVPEHARPH
jgi:hypothetical protein